MYRRLLFVGYTSGLQIWDCTNLESVHEVLNLSGSISSTSSKPRSTSQPGFGQGWGRVRYAAVLPTPSSRDEDEFVDRRPLIGVVYVYFPPAIFLIVFFPPILANHGSW